MERYGQDDHKIGDVGRLGIGQAAQEAEDVQHFVGDGSLATSNNRTNRRFLPPLRAVQSEQQQALLDRWRA